MEKGFNCPACTGEHWEHIETFSYSKVDGARSNSRYLSLRRKLNIFWRILFLAKPDTQVVKCKSLNAYQKLRRNVLFDVWFDGKKEIVELKSRFCRSCGFVCYSPRPEDNDIANKYAYLERHASQDVHEPEQSAYAAKRDLERAERIHQQCVNLITETELDILDYGGGDGKLLIPFKRDNHNCFVIDYYDSPIDGMTKLGNDIRDAKVDRKFDVIICSHVLEHVSNISNILDKLKDYLKEDGIFYAEVPQEVWAGLRIDDDPVTHINFFTKNAFLNLFIAHGFEILESNWTTANFGASALEVVWITAKVSQGNKQNLLPIDTEEMLHPSRFYSLKRLYRLFIQPKLRKRQSNSSV